VPERTYQLVDGHYVGVEGLWGPLLTELRAEREGAIPKLKARHDQTEKWAAGWRPPIKWKPPAEPNARMASHCVREYVCRECGTIYLSREYVRSGDLRVCSDRCKRAHHAAHNRAYFRDNPRDSSMVNQARAKRREKAREGKKCETCGASMDAERSSKKFCSGKCRVAAHRASKSKVESA
jgi:hypothetical protein